MREPPRYGREQTPTELTCAPSAPEPLAERSVKGYIDIPDRVDGFSAAGTLVRVGATG
jgi:hypothetical protein